MLFCAQENTNKAVVADYFGNSPENNTAAFASIAFTSGLSGAFGYFTFNSMDRISMALLVAISGATGLLSYYYSISVHKRTVDQQVIM
jgi:hypothetical protein